MHVIRLGDNDYISVHLYTTPQLFWAQIYDWVEYSQLNETMFRIGQICFFCDSNLFFVFSQEQFYNFDWFGFEPVPYKSKITPTHHSEVLSIVTGGPYSINNLDFVRCTDFICRANKSMKSIQICIVEVTNNPCNTFNVALSQERLSYLGQLEQLFLT